MVQVPLGDAFQNCMEEGMAEGCARVRQVSALPAAGAGCRLCPPTQPPAHSTDSHPLARTVLGGARPSCPRAHRGSPAPCPGPVLPGPLWLGRSKMPPTFGADPALLPNPCPRTGTQASQTPKPLLCWGQRPCMACAPGAERRATAGPFPIGSVCSKQALSPGARRSPEQGSQTLPRPHALPSSPHSTDTDSGHRLAIQWGWGQVGSAEAIPGSWEDGRKAAKNTQHSTRGLWRLGGAD